MALKIPGKPKTSQKPKIQIRKKMLSSSNNEPYLQEIASEPMTIKMKRDKMLTEIRRRERRAKTAIKRRILLDLEPGQNRDQLINLRESLSNTIHGAKTEEKLRGSNGDENTINDNEIHYIEVTLEALSKLDFEWIEAILTDLDWLRLFSRYLRATLPKNAPLGCLIKILRVLKHLCEGSGKISRFLSQDPKFVQAIHQILDLHWGNQKLLKLTISVLSCLIKHNISDFLTLYDLKPRADIFKGVGWVLTEDKERTKKHAPDLTRRVASCLLDIAESIIPYETGSDVSERNLHILAGNSLEVSRLLDDEITDRRILKVWQQFVFKSDFTEETHVDYILEEDILDLFCGKMKQYGTQSRFNIQLYRLAQMIVEKDAHELKQYIHQHDPLMHSLQYYLHNGKAGEVLDAAVECLNAVLWEAPPSYCAKLSSSDLFDLQGAIFELLKNNHSLDYAEHAYELAYTYVSITDQKGLNDFLDVKQDGFDFFIFMLEKFPGKGSKIEARTMALNFLEAALERFGYGGQGEPPNPLVQPARSCETFCTTFTDLMTNGAAFQDEFDNGEGKEDQEMLMMTSGRIQNDYQLIEENIDDCD